MVAGHLLKQGIHVQCAKLHESIHHINPQGVVERRSAAVKRRVYYVECPNGVWHIDGHHINQMKTSCSWRNILR